MLDFDDETMDSYRGYDIIGGDEDFINEGILTREELEEEKAKNFQNSNINNRQLPTVDEVKVPKRRVAEIMAGYNCSVVHDFDDMYHMSEEERNKQFQFYHAFQKVQRMKVKYKSVPKYIIALRAAFECLDSIAEKNGIYSPEKFKKMFYKGDIYITGLEFPVYTGRDKKKINWDEVLDYVYSNQDPYDWNCSTVEDIEADTLEEKMRIMFSEEQLEEIFSAETSDEAVESLNSFYYEDDKELYGENIATPISKKELRSIDRNIIRDAMVEMRRSTDTANRLASAAFDLTEDDFRKIEAYDRKHGFKTSMVPPEFKGNIMSDKDTEKFFTEFDEYEDSIMEERHGKLYTRAQIEELELKEMLQEAGINIMTCYDNKSREKKLKNAIKRDKEKEKRLRKQLTRLEKRREKRKMGDSNGKGKKEKRKKSYD